MIQLTSGGVEIMDGSLEDLKRDFNIKKSVRICNFLSQDICTLFTEYLNDPTLEKKVDISKAGNTIAQEFSLVNAEYILKILFILLNRTKLFKAIEYITDINEISGFDGRIYLMDNREECFDTWHNDIDPIGNRLVGLSLNLSIRPFEGGVFSIRNSKSKELYNTIEWEGQGEVHLFKIESNLEHKVSSVTSQNPRIAYAGWFLGNLTSQEIMNRSIENGGA